VRYLGTLSANVTFAQIRGLLQWNGIVEAYGGWIVKIVWGVGACLVGLTGG
jgi:hypothetical protein